MAGMSCWLPEQDQSLLQHPPKAENLDKNTPEYDFIEEPSQDFFCPVTLELLTEPHQTTCCGNHLSQEAANRLQHDGKPCPMCKEPQLATVVDKYMKRRVNNLRVRCPYKKSGCEWEGEVSTLEDHINSCPKRPWNCLYCGFHTTYYTGMSEHVPKCTQQPVVCPNSCEVDSLPRCELEAHLMECPLEPVPCEYAEVGCDAKIPRRDLARHMQEGLQQHLLSATLLNLRLTREKLAEKDRVIAAKEEIIVNRDTVISEKDHEIIDMRRQIADLKEQLKTQQEGIMAALRRDVRDEQYIISRGFACHNFLVKGINKGYIWESEEFSSKEYKLKVSFSPERFSTNVKVFVALRQGTNDHKLKWPVTFTFYVRVINQLGDHSHLEKVGRVEFTKKEYFYKALTPNNIISIPRSTSTLDYNAENCTQYYVQGNCLEVKVYVRCESLNFDTS